MLHNLNITLPSCVNHSNLSFTNKRSAIYDDQINFHQTSASHLKTTLRIKFSVNFNILGLMNITFNEIFSLTKPQIQNNY